LKAGSPKSLTRSQPLRLLLNLRRLPPPSCPLSRPSRMVESVGQRLPFILILYSIMVDGHLYNRTIEMAKVDGESDSSTRVWLLLLLSRRLGDFLFLKWSIVLSKLFLVKKKEKMIPQHCHSESSGFRFSTYYVSFFSLSKS